VLRSGPWSRSVAHHGVDPMALQTVAAAQGCEFDQK